MTTNQVDNISKMYPACPQFFDQSEFNFNEYLPGTQVSHFNAKSSMFNITELQEIQFTLIQYLETLYLTHEKNKQNKAITYVAMTIFHLCTKWYQNQIPQPKFDIKLLLISSLRISAVIHDLELSQDQYSKAYYDSVIRDDAKANGSDMQSPTSHSTSMTAGNPTTAGCVYIVFDKIKNQLRDKLLLN